MNTIWNTFLAAQLASVEGQELTFPELHKVNGKAIYPIAGLATLSIMGKDAATLLQGQVTCNVNDISESNSSIAAMCNPKGRAIATFLLAKAADGFVLVLPVELLETVKKKLQMYVLRSDVTITDRSDHLCVFGIGDTEQSLQAYASDSQQNLISIKLPVSSRRKLLLMVADKAVQFWQEHLEQQGFRLAGMEEWRSLDLISGLPWLTTTTSEEFIPQMLNLDKLGGISFNKGCYTGQEIVARTHYLGKAKREMRLAECQTNHLPEPNNSLIDLANDQQDVAGKVLMAIQDKQNCRMLVVLQSPESGYGNLVLQDDKQVQVNLIPYVND